MKPYKTCPETFYARLFAPEERWTNEAEWQARLRDLTQLVDTMIDDGGRPSSNDFAIDAGYTYFGQFVDHDLTNDSASLADAMVLEPHEILNRQTPRLDLGHLYGRGPFHHQDCFLYEEADVRLRVGAETKSSLGIRGAWRRSFDLAMGDDGRPVAFDPRANENLILRQITAVFARLHNLAVEQNRRATTNLHQLFVRARRQTSWQFQRLLVDDYLPTILQPDIYRQVFVEQNPRFEWDRFSIPVEFSAAAMRFGHSMVRDGYLISNATAVKLSELVRIGLSPGPLPEKFEIDWGRFFQGAGSGGPATTAQPIDALISAGMFQIPLDALELFNAAVPAPAVKASAPPLPLVTLTRGMALRLSCGQTVARALGEEILSDRELTCDRAGRMTAQGEALAEFGLTSATPLWFYLLKESEVRENGNSLGRTGSRLVAETFHAALKHDPDSYLNHPEAGLAPLWEVNGGRRQLLSLAALFEAALFF